MSFEIGTHKLPPPEVCAEMENRGIPVHNAEAAIKQIAKGITSNEHFCAFLLTVSDERRKEAYEAISPNLSFKDLPFTIVMAKRNKVQRQMKRRLGWVPRTS